MDVPRTSHYSRRLTVPISKAFQYYRDIEAYTKCYPDYCKKVDIIERSSNDISIKTREFWNISIDNNTDHVVLDVNYSFFPLTEILYEIVDSSKKKINWNQNHVLLEEMEDNETGVEINNVLLDAVCFPPYSSESGRYMELIDYFTVKDCIHLENKPTEPFKEGQLCTRCFKGRLQPPRTKEIYEKDMINLCIFDKIFLYILFKVEAIDEFKTVLDCSCSYCCIWYCSSNSSGWSTYYNRTSNSAERNR